MKYDWNQKLILRRMHGIGGVIFYEENNTLKYEHIN
jgi:hypothetical protein